MNRRPGGNLRSISMKQITIAHTGDLHYSADTLVEVDRCMRAMIDQLDTVDAVVIGGDSTDHRLDAHTPAFIALASRVKEIASQRPLLMLQGTFSHEPQGMLRLLGLLSDNIAIADRICQFALTEKGWVQSAGYAFNDQELASQAVRCVFSCLPTINRAQVVAKTDDVKGSNEAAGEAIAAILRGWGIVNERFASAGIPTVGVTHGTVSGCSTEHGVPMHGTDHELTSGLVFSANAAAFMLNHIHLHQHWEVNGRRAAYSGSLPCLHYGERGTKGWLRWQVAARSAQFELIASPAQLFAEFNFSGPPDLTTLAKAEVAGCKVRVRYTIDAEHRAAIDSDAIKHALLGMGAIEVKIEPRIVPVTRTRATGMAAAMTHADRLRRWCEANNIPDAQATRLAWLLEKISNDDTSTLVQEIVGA
jgi:DNA repair protein SbcD/Mre11